MIRQVEKIIKLACAESRAILERFNGVNLIVSIVDTAQIRNSYILNGSIWMNLFREIILRLKDDFDSLIRNSQFGNDVVQITGVSYDLHAASPTETISHSASGKKSKV